MKLQDLLKHIESTSIDQEDRNHSNKDDEVIYNITNPNSIYIKVEIKFKGYKPFHLHAYIDTGASMCLISPHLIPEPLWKQSEKLLRAKIGDGSIITINKEIHNLIIEIEQVKFTISKLYLLHSGIDLILGNNFLNEHLPFIQELNHIILTKNKSLIYVPKVKAALQIGTPGILDGFKKLKKPIIQNITFTQELQDTLDDLYDELIFLYHPEEDKIKQLLKQVCSEHPQDQTIKRKKFIAHIELLPDKKNKIIRAKPMIYTREDRLEFQIQIT